MVPAHRRAALLLAIVSIILIGALVRPARSLPTRDDAVVARVPARATDPAVREMAQLSVRLGKNPQDAETAVALARLGTTEGRRRADPRFLARAQAALAPWWQEKDPPAEILLLRATIEQARHDFDAALADLDRLLVRTDDPHAQLTRAVVLTVRGKFAEARGSCAALADPLVAAICLAPIDAATGNVALAVERLTALLPSARPAEVAWGHSVLGELLYWRGDATAAAHLTRALALDPGDGYTRAVLADLLLDEGRPADAARLLTGLEHDDALLLRVAIADKRLGHHGGAAAELRGRFESERVRGDAVHIREEARFALDVEGDAARALALARQNWRVQREPWDARLVIAAARAAGTTDEADAFARERGDGWRRAGGAR
jgi:tetratricopeptide (TPR) repeat protein